MKIRDEWQDIRRLSRYIIEDAGLFINPPKKPFWMPDEMEIWWNDYRELKH